MTKSSQHINQQNSERAASGNAGPNAASSSSVVQMYSKVPVDEQEEGKWNAGYDLRVSDDGNMAVRDSEVFEGGKDMFATSEVIADASQRLQDVESPFDIVQGDEQLDGIVPKSNWLPFSRGKEVTLFKTTVKDLRKGEDDPTGSGEGITTIEACSAHGLDFMGIGTTASAQRNSNRFAGIGVGNNEEVVNTGASLGKNVTNDYTARNIILQKIAKIELGLGLDAEDVSITEAKDIYANLEESERAVYAEQFGINQFATPEVGDSVEQMRANGQGNPGAFPMHFAPVVAKSGSDYVTFENFAKSINDRKVGDTSEASNDWYFRMYGPVKKFWLHADEDQSYYGEHAEEGSIGDRDNAMSLVNRNRRKE